MLEDPGAHQPVSRTCLCRKLDFRGERSLMKKQPKKLTLHRETLRRLEEETLELAAGGTGSACHCSITNCTSVCHFPVLTCEGC